MMKGATPMKQNQGTDARQQKIMHHFRNALLIIHYKIINYSTVTLLAKFLGLSTSIFFATPVK